MTMAETLCVRFGVDPKGKTAEPADSIEMITRLITNVPDELDPLMLDIVSGLLFYSWRNRDTK